jgi:hypothetical protein
VFLNFALEYAIRKVQEKHVGLKLTEVHQLLAYAIINLLDDNINTTNKNTETFTDASKEVRLEVNAEKTKCSPVTRIQGKIIT